jgi:parallel beta-helix repeat protein
MNRTSNPWLILLASLLFAPAMASAQTITCANSWAAIATALGNTSGVGGEHEIRIVQGTYAMSGSVAITPEASATLRLMGGYAPGCGSRSVDAGNTEITGLNLYYLHLLGVKGAVALDGLTLRNTAGVYLQGAAEAKPTMYISHSVIRNAVGGGAGVAISSPRGTITVVNSVFANLSVSGSGCALLLDAPYVYSGYGLPTGVSLIQNTITAATGSGGNAAVCVYARRGEAYNNIFHANAPRDVDFAAENTIAFRHNIVDGAYATGPYENSANFDADPLFVNAAGNNFDLQLASPAANASPLNPNVDYDLHGGPRLVGSAFDLGADESSFNNYSDLVVTNTADSGAGSLRAAITAANANADLNRIAFNIPGTCGSQAILVLSALPDITAPLLIDGYSQTGAHQNTALVAFNADVCVSLNAINPATVSTGLRVSASAASTVQLAVWGLGFGNFGTGGAIRLSGGRGHNISGNQFAGTLPTGGTLSPNVRNILISDAAEALRVGGPGLWQRNLISGASNFDGISVSNTDSYGPDITIENNLIGLNAARTAALPNAGAGISLYNTAGVTVIDNAIGGNDGAGIAISGGLSSSIRNNAIGASFSFPGFSVGNRHGITVSGGNIASVLGNSAYTEGGGNDIGFNDEAGVWVIDGSRVAIRGNRISNNGALGIDLGSSQGVTLNDAGDADAGPNRLQNYPHHDSATVYGNVTVIESALFAEASSEYRIDFYNSDSCDGLTTHGEGKTPIGRVTATTSSSGEVSFNFTLSEALPVGSVVTATATKRGPGLPGDTSEFSTCETVVAGLDELFDDGFED